MASETEQELRRHLEGIDFAANTQDLIAMAMHNGAPEDFIDASTSLRNSRQRNSRTSKKLRKP